jgi:hypothetical protein
MEIVSEGMLESQQSRSNLDQNWLRGMGIVSRRYARNTAVSVKSGSKLAERYGKSIRILRYARHTTVSVTSGSGLTEKYGDSTRKYA